MSVGEPDAVTPHVRFDERDVETEHLPAPSAARQAGGGAIEAPPDERGGNR